MLYGMSAIEMFDSIKNSRSREFIPANVFLQKFIPWKVYYLKVFIEFYRHARKGTLFHPSYTLDWVLPSDTKYDFHISQMFLFIHISNQVSKNTGT